MQDRPRQDPQPDHGKGPPDGKGQPIDHGRPVPHHGSAAQIFAPLTRAKPLA